MTYVLKITPAAERDLDSLDRAVGDRITRWLLKNIDGCSDPRRTGKALTGNKAGLWRYRVGDYRIVVEIRDDVLVVLAVGVGHRSSIYK